MLWLLNLCQTIKWKYIQLRFWSTGGFTACYPLNIAAFKDPRFIHKEGWKQSNPQNISFSVKSVCEEIKSNNRKVVWILLMPLTFCQISRGSRTLEQRLFLFSEFERYDRSSSVTLKSGKKHFFFPQMNSSLAEFTR